MDKYEPLDNTIVTEIKKFLEQKWSNEKIGTLFPNIIPRNDILRILDRYCTVIFYPIENENNNGFHISDIPGQAGEMNHFVFINTAQTSEKQVFTAAHELGHVWKVEEKICNVCAIQSDEKITERIVNRFAAELLMPETQFKEQFGNKLQDVHRTDNRVPFDEFIKLTAFLMNTFLVPMKAVFMRMAELDIVSGSTINLLIDDSDPSFMKMIQTKLERYIREEQYLELVTPDKKKMIEGLPKLLEEAETKRSVSNEKIQHIRKMFDLAPQTNGDSYEQTIELESELNKWQQ